jgi:steroid delta-isomerase-like uncharacterized protein
MAMKRTEKDAILEVWLEAWRRRDAIGLAAAFAEDANYTSMLAGTIRGRKEIEALYRSWFTAFPDMVFQEESRLTDRDRTAILWLQNGTHRGEFCGLVGTGRSFTLSGAFFMTFRDGRIISMRSIYDFTGLLLQIGILKAKPAV